MRHMFDRLRTPTVRGPDAEILPPGEKTWADLVRLRDRLAGLTNGRNTDVMISIWVDNVTVTLDIGGSKYTGRGKDPWEAVDDIMAQSGSLANKLKEI